MAGGSDAREPAFSPARPAGRRALDAPRPMRGIGEILDSRAQWLVQAEDFTR
jgi:hypothetical protein